MLVALTQPLDDRGFLGEREGERVQRTLAFGKFRPSTELPDRIRVEEEWKRAKEAAERNIQAKSAFLANMGHELRTPLNHIIGFTELVVDKQAGDLNESQAEYLGDVLASSRHLLSLINDILDLSKIEAGKMELNFEDNVTIPELINSVMATVTGLVKDKPIRLIRDIAPDLPVVRADPLKIRQVLLNLLSNAAKFTERGEIGVTISCVGEPSEQVMLRIEVRDTGIGIPPCGT